MAGEGDLQALLRMFTSRKVTMLAAMGHVKTLQSKGLRSIAQIAEAPPADVEAIIGDAKLAKSVHAACKSHDKKAVKRPAEEQESATGAKKAKLQVHKHDLDYSSMSSDDLERSLSLPLVEEEQLIKGTSIVTNRAPLFLAFAVELLGFTMPEQPPSSRLSLAQAVVSANSRSKALSLGIEKPSPGGEPQVIEGQPKLRVMTREVPILKRGGYSWSGAPEASGTASNSQARHSSTQPRTWNASRKTTVKSSTFIAHAAQISSPSQRAELIKSLMEQKPELETATHNAWALRTSYGNSPLVQELSYDDGESGCGKFMLQLMREADAKNTIVVLTRWYGGIMLGPDRWRIMRECVQDALSAQMRTSSFSGEAVWALDLQDDKPSTSTVGMAIHRPENARNYLLRSFPSAEADGASAAKKTGPALMEEKQENLGRLLGALRLLFRSWADVLKKDELDSRAWSWYIKVRPDVDAGPSGWGAKGTVSLDRILELRRKG
ncbi:hypothetical protein S40285_01604 [Stachybotrys chlorohalonatus IBT 40285]|uniref:Impact N-terminal domain-containing protein n=1 Tax=Stachybotrys chlorohalonatus (strain IBT 40285) TaxID=1283841 RepID=A0A084QWA6_STAC4|nr:hypothetical protein S40285_01604 [Stachybotrys chlorohalonata IBT 40285]